MSEAAAYADYTRADYTRRLVRSAVGLTRLARHAQTLGDADEAARLEAALHRIETVFFQVAVVGEFKHGKSTFINALLGAPVLPADVMPATATVSRVIWGREPSAELVFHDGRRQPMPIPDLVQHITQITPEASRRAEQVREAVISFPTPFCSDNVHLIDTPGLDDTAAMTRLTREILPGADAAILVLSALQPFAQTEAEFLRELLGFIDPERLFVVVNRLDQLSEAEATRLLPLVEERVRRTVVQAVGETRALPPRRLFGVSALAALSAKQRHDHDALFQAFSDALRHYLSRDRFDAALQPAFQTIHRSVPALHDRLAQRRRNAFRAINAQLERLNTEQSALASHAAAVTSLRSGLEARLSQQRDALLASVDEELAQLRDEIAAGVQAIPIAPNDIDDGAALHARVTGELKVLGNRRFGAFCRRSIDVLCADAARERSQLDAAGRTLAAIMQASPSRPLLPALGHPDEQSIRAALTKLASDFEAGFAPGYGSMGRITLESRKFFGRASAKAGRVFGGQSDTEVLAVEEQARQAAIKDLRQSYIKSSQDAASALFRSLDVGTVLASTFEDVAVRLRYHWAERAPEIDDLIKARHVEIKVESARIEQRAVFTRERFLAQERELAEIAEAARGDHDKVVAHLSRRGIPPPASS